jgi:RNA-binding protein YhbY
MMANKKDNERDRYFTFFWFENEIKQRGVKNVWEDILRNFLQIKEWYADRVMYHKIGYLISSDSASMADILNIAKGRRKSELLQEIKTLIANSINFKLKEGDTYSDLNYEKNYKEINKLLLLFNVESIIAEEVYQRFPFGKYNTAEWSLEHIHAQNSQGLKNKDTQIEWIKMHIKSVKAVSPNGQYESLLNELETIVKSEKIESRGSFDELFNAVCNALSENTDTEYIHTISNMALLSRCDNSALNNSTFDVKRNQIIEMDKKGAFIPYCTKMVFLKYYTPSSDNQIHFWGERDREAYISAINKTLKPYLLLIDQTF